MATDHGARAGSSIDPVRMIEEARRAFFTVFGFLCAVWVLQVVNWLDDSRLFVDGGIRPHDVSALPNLLSAPFLHLNWAHLEGNSGPLFVFGFLAAYRGVKKFLGLTLLVALTSGAAVWCFADVRSVTAGASGVVFGYFGYVVLRGLFDRNLIDSLIGLVMFASFAYLLTTALPGTPGISWLGHLGGLLGGLAGAWIFRDRSTRRAAAATAVPAQTGGARPDSPRAALHKELDDLGL
ncbi:rhomboid family intramembrane serine protease [Kitasatospora terrestris]|uniref:Rhomboid family intramembrane serine protease n=1 Tax=Kitasatospora terrestris TaxID=258051 RepID=A0ABP9DUE5_9ACTN